MKYLIVGLGNIGSEYEHTRHNIGFEVLDAFAKASNIVFEDRRYGAVAYGRIKNRSLVLLKPSTFMNLSGNAVRYWMTKEKIDIHHLLVITDDLSMPFGSLRLRNKGSDGGHNGLKHIIETLGTQNFARLRFGIGSDFPKGMQVDYVLSRFSKEEQDLLPDRIEMSEKIIASFCLEGVDKAMNAYNNK